MRPPLEMYTDELKRILLRQRVIPALPGLNVLRHRRNLRIPQIRQHLRVYLNLPRRRRKRIVLQILNLLSKGNIGFIKLKPVNPLPLKRLIVRLYRLINKTIKRRPYTKSPFSKDCFSENSPNRARYYQHFVSAQQASFFHLITYLMRQKLTSIWLPSASHCMASNTMAKIRASQEFSDAQRVVLSIKEFIWATKTSLS